MMKKMNFRELISYIKYDKDPTQFDGILSIGIKWGDTFYSDIADLLGAGLPNFSWVDGEDITEYAKQIINRVVERYSYDWVITCFADLSEEYIEVEVYKFIDQFINILNNTYNKYAELLQYYTNAKGKLMDGIKKIEEGETSANAKNRFNDTPQNLDVNGETFDDIDHTTNLNLNNATGESTITTTDEKYELVERLDKVNRLYADLMLDWSNKFSRLFIPYVNGEKYER